MTKPAKLLIEHTYRTQLGRLAQPKGEWWGWPAVNTILAGIAVCQIATLVRWFV